jgi:hypothetical protein
MYKRREGRIPFDAPAKHIPYKLPTFTIEELKKEYQLQGIEITEDELKEKRQLFDFLHESIYQTYTINKKEKEAKDEQSNFIYPCEYRRAS